MSCQGSEKVFVVVVVVVEDYSTLQYMTNFGLFAYPQIDHWMLGILSATDLSICPILVIENGQNVQICVIYCYCEKQKNARRKTCNQQYTKFKSQMFVLWIKDFKCLRLFANVVLGTDFEKPLGVFSVW